MAAQNLAEFTVKAIIAKLKADLPAQLAEVRADRTVPSVTTEPPVDYFNYEKIIGYKTPAVVVVATDIDFRKPDGQNFIEALTTVLVSVVLEDRNAELLTTKAYRYSDAFHKVLDRAHLDDTTQNIRDILKVTRIDYSRTMETASRVDSPFRKEVMLTLEVEHYESED